MLQFLLRTFLARAEEAFCRELDMVTLADLVRGNCGFGSMLALHAKLTADCAAQAAAD